MNGDWLLDINNWRLQGNLPTAMADRRRLDARAPVQDALPINSPILGMIV